MTKTTLKALWLGGGGVLATWLAVTPNQGMPTSAPTQAQRPAVAREPSADELRAKTNRIRARTNTAALRASTRNPFRFTASRSSPASGPSVAPPAPVGLPAPAVALPPALTLNGVTGKQTADGVRRTAVISGDGLMYFVGEGDSVAGRYTVIKIDPEAVVLRDADGAEVRLGLP